MISQFKEQTLRERELKRLEFRRRANEAPTEAKRRYWTDRADSISLRGLLTPAEAKSGNLARRLIERLRQLIKKDPT